MLTYLTGLTQKSYYYAIILLLIILFSGMRVSFIHADAPGDLTISAAIYTDEGFKTYSSRNMVLYGSTRWTPEDRYRSWVTRGPLSTLSYDQVFKIFGTGFFSIRILSILYSILTMILLFIFLIRNFDRLTALIGLTIFGVDFYTTMFSRLGFFEIHLLFYLVIALMGFSEAFRKREKGKATQTPLIRAGGILRRIPFFTLALAAITVGFYIKRSLLIAAVAIAPGLLIYFLSRLGPLKKLRNTVFISILGIILIGYFLLGSITLFKEFYIYLLLLTKVGSQSLSTYLPIVLFDPIHISIGKGLYMEFIFLHPFIFAAGMIYSLYTFYAVIFKERDSTIDLILSSWFLFGFLILSISYYHPARYYLMLILPLVILTTRAITQFSTAALGPYLTEKKHFPHGVMLTVVVLFATVYAGTSAVVQILPFSFREHLVRTLYPAALNKDYGAILPIAVPLLLFVFGLAAFLIVKRKWIQTAVSGPRFPSILLTLILSLQGVQYLRWFIFHETKLYTVSKELGKELPQNAVLAGSWSAGLVIENRIKPLIIQSYVPYNHEILKQLIQNHPIPITEKDGDTVTTKNTKNIPLYFSICKDVIFERTIAQFYKNYLTPKNLIKNVRMGYFNVEIYRIDRSIPYSEDKKSDYYQWLQKNFSKMEVPTGH